MKKADSDTINYLYCFVKHNLTQYNSQTWKNCQNDLQSLSGLWMRDYKGTGFSSGHGTDVRCRESYTGTDLCKLPWRQSLLISVCLRNIIQATYIFLHLLILVGSSVEVAVGQPHPVGLRKQEGSRGTRRRRHVRSPPVVTAVQAAGMFV